MIYEQKEQKIWKVCYEDGKVLCVYYESMLKASAHKK